MLRWHHDSLTDPHRPYSERRPGAQVGARSRELPDAAVRGEVPMHRSPLVLGFTCSLLAAVGGCRGKPTPVAPPEPPVIPVSRPVEREVTDYVDFTGRTAAVQSVDIRPRVTGYLVKIPFKEGAMVKAGDLLFVVDRRPYEAQLDQAQGQVNLYQAQLKLARTVYARDRAINARVAE